VFFCSCSVNTVSCIIYKHVRDLYPYQILHA
jgi:hypothetical protein